MSENSGSLSNPLPSRERVARPKAEPGEGACPTAPRGRIPRARALRRMSTDAERALWRVLRDRRLQQFKFRRQVPVGPYITDFLCYEARLVVEVDGGQHAESATDRERETWLAANGYRVLRCWNNEVLGNAEGVLTAIANALRGAGAPHPDRASRGHPSPARGEGDSVPSGERRW